MDKKADSITWPPEKPTATTPNSLPADKNLGEIVDGEVIIVVFDKVARMWNAAYTDELSAGDRRIQRSTYLATIEWKELKKEETER